MCSCMACNVVTWDEHSGMHVWAANICLIVHGYKGLCQLAGPRSMLLLLLHI